MFFIQFFYVILLACSILCQTIYMAKNCNETFAPCCSPYVVLSVNQKLGS